LLHYGSAKDQKPNTYTITNYEDVCNLWWIRYATGQLEFHCWSWFLHLEIRSCSFDTEKFNFASILTTYKRKQRKRKTKQHTLYLQRRMMK